MPEPGLNPGSEAAATHSPLLRKSQEKRKKRPKEHETAAPRSPSELLSPCHGTAHVGPTRWAQDATHHPGPPQSYPLLYLGIGVRPLFKLSLTVHLSGQPLLQIKDRRWVPACVCYVALHQKIKALPSPWRLQNPAIPQHTADRPTGTS